jgi:hypothetical protein
MFSETLSLVYSKDVASVLWLNYIFSGSGFNAKKMKDGSAVIRVNIHQLPYQYQSFVIKIGLMILLFPSYLH